MAWWYGALRPLVRRGYRPAEPPQNEPEWVVPAEPARGGIVAFCPTYAGEGNQISQMESVEALAEQLAHIASCVLIVGMQYAPGARTLAASRLEALREAVSRRGVPFGGFLLAGFGKVRSVNAALAAALEWRAAGLLQMDDDIRLEPGAIAALVKAYDAGGRRGAVGAAKSGRARAHKASRLLLWLKGQTRPACNYPHACCMLLNPVALAPGIPGRYASDDGYICFTLLRPASADPFELLRIVP